jgi:hypothetical protein
MDQDYLPCVMQVIRWLERPGDCNVLDTTCLLVVNAEVVRSSFSVSNYRESKANFVCSLTRKNFPIILEHGENGEMGTYNTGQLPLMHSFDLLLSLDPPYVPPQLNRRFLSVDWAAHVM